MVTVYVPFVPGRLDPDTWRAVLAAGGPAQFLAIDSDEPAAYGRLVRRLWAKAETMIICEHDVVPTPEQVETIRSCGHGWCSYPYDSDLYPAGPYFGLVKFSGQVMRDHPRAAEVALHTGNSKQFEVGWWEVDSMMARDLFIRGVEWSQHSPPVRHNHPGPATGTPMT